MCQKVSSSIIILLLGALPTDLRSWYANRLDQVLDGLRTVEGITITIPCMDEGTEFFSSAINYKHLPDDSSTPFYIDSVLSHAIYSQFHYKLSEIGFLVHNHYNRA
jgi:hypothetical protein